MPESVELKRDIQLQHAIDCLYKQIEALLRISNLQSQLICRLELRVEELEKLEKRV